jgi:outer membrane protein assembly factor BamB
MTSYTTSTNPSNSWFGYYYSQDDPNQHGIVNPGWLFTPDYRRSLQPERGIPGIFNITNVPVATASVEINGPAGENLRYQLVNKGASGYYLAQWNSSKVIPSSSDGGTMNNIDASTANRFDWNISMPWNFSTSPTIRAAKLGDILFGSNGSWPSASGSPSYAYPDQVTIWAVSLKLSTLGQVIYMKNLQIDDATANTNQLFERASADAGVFVTNEVPLCKFHVYDMHTGNELFSTDSQADLNPYGYFTWPSQIAVTQTKLAYGMLYVGGYSGAVSAYNIATHQLQWRHVYPSGGEKIQNFVQMLAMIADGKIYVGTHEHSADTPLYKGEQIHCLNATTGETIWDLNAWGYPETFATADGVLIFWNNYDAQVYAVGKGPTQMTVTAPSTGAEFGTPIVIRGTVTDISAGTKQQAQAARFPNGVAAVSDASQQGWMDYVYMQKGRPNNTTGVPVTISVVDANGNFRTIGTPTSDSSGMFTYTWTPDIQGSYTVIASFAGTESYWPSYAESSFAVSNPHPTANPTQQITLPPTETYFAISTAAIIIAIAIVGLLIVLILRKRP